jgi:outer membrane protein OmpA-like peptidoglycan-associated protein
LTKIEQIGHNDDIGSHDANKALSIARAKRLAEYVILQGIPREKINTNTGSWRNPANRF